MYNTVNENGFIRNFLKETLLEKVEQGKRWNPNITIPMMERTHLTELTTKEQRAKYKDKLLRIIEAVYAEYDAPKLTCASRGINICSKLS